MSERMSGLSFRRSLFRGFAFLIHSEAHANRSGLGPVLFESRPPRRARLASLSNTARNAALPVSQKTSERNLSSSDSVSILLMRALFLVMFFFFQEDGAWPPRGGVRNS